MKASTRFELNEQLAGANSIEFNGLKQQILKLEVVGNIFEIFLSDSMDNHPRWAQNSKVPILWFLPNPYFLLHSEKIQIIFVWNDNTAFHNFLSSMMMLGYTYIIIEGNKRFLTRHLTSFSCAFCVHYIIKIKIRYN